MLKQLLNKNKPSTLSQQNMEGKRKKNKLLQFKQDTNNPVLNEIMLQMRDKKKLAELGRNYVHSQNASEFSEDLSDNVDISTFNKLRAVELKNASNSSVEHMQKRVNQNGQEIDFDVFGLL
ncbi:Hypothetical_protein [Hexamita inflata]|uniref:Hypothetical_protein n=1 Tax=Hexamita inflata TaxID=28002 RepID=A0AA86PU30_9EUKA|nr:Hypothetical protein HINF_LOCUS29110 [Hexamita inflata]